MRRLETLRAGQGEAVAVVSGEISAKLEAAGVPARVLGREKHPYSIWRKLQRKSIGFSQLSDIYAFRVIVDTEDRLLPRAGRHPPRLALRARAVQGLHLDAQAQQLPLAAHHGGRARAACASRCRSAPRRWTGWPRRAWPPTGATRTSPTASTPRRWRPAGGRDPLVNLRHLVQVLEHGGDAEDLVEHAKLEMFLDQVFVFTPKGRLISLPRGAMPLDFAYAVHSDVGDTARGGEDQRRAASPLRTAAAQRRRGRGDPGRQAASPIRNGSRWRSPAARARPSAATSARPRRRSSSASAAPRSTRPSSGPASARAEVSLRPALDRFGVASEEELFDAVGRGRVAAGPGAGGGVPRPEGDRKGRRRRRRRRIEDGKGARLYVRGGGLTPGVTLHFGDCCDPVPGDRIVGILRDDGGA